jgi:hypothetical protein
MMILLAAAKKGIVMIRWSPAALLLFICMLLFAPPAHATHVQCGDVITQDTTLDSDLVSCELGLRIGAASVTLDLNGHTIRGLGVASGISGTSGQPHSNVVIRGRGTVEGFNMGIDLQTLPDATVQGLTIQGNVGGVYATETFGHRIIDNLVQDNADFGIGQFDSETGTRGTRIERNSIRGNGGNGVALSFSGAELVNNHIADNGASGVAAFSARLDATRNTIEGNDFSGIAMSSFATGEITANAIAGNGRDGLLLEGAARADAVRDNTIERNGRNGISVQAGAGGDMLLERNRLSRNALDGIFVSLGALSTIIVANRSDRNGDDGIDTDVPDTTLTGNRADHNVDLGIEAVPGVTDGGGNRAKHNGNPAQCLNVACGK